MTYPGVMSLLQPHTHVSQVVHPPSHRAELPAHLGQSVASQFCQIMCDDDDDDGGSGGDDDDDDDDDDDNIHVLDLHD